MGVIREVLSELETKLTSLGGGQVGKYMSDGESNEDTAEKLEESEGVKISDIFACLHTVMIPPL